MLIRLKPVLLNCYDNQLLTVLSVGRMTKEAEKIDWKDLVSRSGHLATLG